MSNRITSFTFNKKPSGFIPGKEAVIDGRRVHFAPQKAYQGMTHIFEKLKVHNKAIYDKAADLKSFTIELTSIPDSTHYAVQIISERLIIKLDFKPETAEKLMSALNVPAPTLTPHFPYHLPERRESFVFVRPAEPTLFTRAKIFLSSLFSKRGKSAANLFFSSKKAAPKVVELPPSTKHVTFADDTAVEEEVDHPVVRSPTPQPLADDHLSSLIHDGANFFNPVAPQAFERSPSLVESDDDDCQFVDALDEPWSSDDEEVEFHFVEDAEQTAAFEAEVKELIRRVAPPVLSKKERVQKLLPESESIRQLLQVDDPVVEKVLDRILAQQLSIEQVEAEVKVVVAHLEATQLKKQLAAEEAKLKEADAAFRHQMATEPLTVKLKDLMGFGRFDIGKNWRTLYEEQLAEFESRLKTNEESLAILEEFMSIKTAAEGRALLDAFVAEQAGAPYHADLAKCVQNLNELNKVLQQMKTAYKFQIPYLMAKVATYAGIQKEIEQLRTKLPEKIFRKFSLLFGDQLRTGIGEVLPESMMSSFPDPREGIAKDIGFLKEKIAAWKAKIEKAQREAKPLEIIERIVRDIETVKALSPESIAEIQKLEETEYVVTGDMIWLRRESKAPEENRISKLLQKMSSAVVACRQQFSQTREEYVSAGRKLADGLKLCPSAKALIG